MKLKKAMKIAKKSNYNYVAVDANRDVYMFKDNPEVLQEDNNVWDSCGSMECIGIYTGKKAWKDTLRNCNKSSPATFLQDWDEYRAMLQDEVKPSKENTRMDKLRNMKSFIDREIETEESKEEYNNG